MTNADPAAAAVITHGNERVLEGRLADAEFSYDRDLAEGLEAMAGRLGEVVFHAKLGSLADKSARMVALMQWLAGVVTGRDGAAASRAAAPLGHRRRFEYGRSRRHRGGGRRGRRPGPHRARHRRARRPP